eukprot:g775.t1
MLGGHMATGGRKGKKESHHRVYADQMLPCEEARDFVRRLKLKSNKEWKEWSKSGQRPSNVPSNPHEVYKGKGWVSMPDWMGYTYTKGDGGKKNRKTVLSFIAARDIVRKLKMMSHKEWKEWSKSGQRPSNVPSAPERVYKGKGWISLPDWMGYQYTKGDEGKKRKKMVMSFISARAIVRKLKMTSAEEWKEWRKSGQRPGNVPSCPDQVYKGKGWVSWPDWMGYSPKRVVGNMLSFIAARDIVRKLKMTSAREWQEWSKSGQRPSNVPGSPHLVYKGKGWVSWPDWMGYQYTKGDQMRKELLPFEKARAVARNQNLTSLKEWKEWRKSGQRPSNVPSHPDQTYKGKGWVSYPDWMGYQYTKGDENKKRKRKRAHQAANSSAATSSSSSSSSLPPLDNCSICFEPLCPVTTDIGHLNCVHTFHVDCLNGHARASATPSTTSRRGVLLNCPLCRKRTRWLPPPPE